MCLFCNTGVAMCDVTLVLPCLVAHVGVFWCCYVLMLGHVCVAMLVLLFLGVDVAQCAAVWCC